MAALHKSALLIGAGVAIFAVSIGLTSAVLSSHPSWLLALKRGRSPKSATVCKIIATDPNPPLNVRSSPVAAPDNIVGTLKNGTPLQVVDENEGWLRITAPVAGWVYKELTATSCISARTDQNNVPIATDDNANRLTEATAYYHAGNLNAAIALAKMVPANSPDYPTAQAAIAKWQQDWQTAEAEFYAAQKALRDGRWQDVINKVKTFPDNRYWRARLAPLVKQALQRQNAAV